MVFPFQATFVHGAAAGPARVIFEPLVDAVSAWKPLISTLFYKAVGKCLVFGIKQWVLVIMVKNAKNSTLYPETDTY